MSRPYFTLIHATYNSQESLDAHFKKWISACQVPQDVEYIFAMERGDLNEREHPTGFRKVITVPGDGRSSAVLNWNAAAAAATGEILFAISDDLTPPKNWDAELKNAIGTTCASKTRFVMKVKDSHDLADSLVSHPIVSRKHYEDLGLFDPAFSSMYCDNDFTWKAFFSSEIFDCRGIEFLHSHPHLGGFAETESHRRNNRQLEYDFGLRQFQKRWPPFIEPAGARRLPLRSFPPARRATLVFARITVLLSALRGFFVKRLLMRRNSGHGALSV